MKIKIILFIFGLLPNLSLATVHLVQVTNNSFVPDSFSAQCGDTITWQWIEGTHTTSSDTIPPCAAAGHTWNVALHSANQTFSYIIPCEGLYSYKCNFHAMMTGTFSVACNTSISEPVSQNDIPLVFPNPFNDELNILLPGHGLSDLSCEITDVFGTVVRKISNCKNPGSSMLIGGFDVYPKGVYFIRMTSNGVTATRKLVHQ